MNVKMLCSALVLAGLVAGPAHAQYFGFGSGYSYGFQPNGTYGYGPPYGYGVNMPTYAPGGYTYSPYTGFQPFGAYGGGYGFSYPTPGGWQYWATGGLSPTNPLNYPSNPTVPTLGINAPVAPAPGIGPEPAPSQRVAGARQETTDQEQTSVTLTMEDVMSKHPLCQGTVLKLGATAVQVRYEVGGHVHITRFQPGQVFFFKPDGRLAVASRDASSLHEGDHVLIPQPSWSR